jgi:hypothetical protein
VQYNNAGAFGGVSGFTTDGTRVTASTTIGVGGATPSTSGAGITFPATQSASTDANTLDDYEEGTWTPTVIGTTTAGTASYIRVATYTKIGNTVFVTCYIEWSGGTGTGNLRITGLPFSPAVNSTATIGLCSGLTLTAANVVSLYMNSGLSDVIFSQYPVGGGASSTVPYDANVSPFIFSATYTT